MKALTKTLTERQKRFCQEYVKDLNGAQAAIRAGYSKRTAKEQAVRLLTNINLQKYIYHLMKKREKRVEITQDRVLLEIARLAFSDPRKAFDGNGNLLPVQEWPDEVAASISSIKIVETKDNNGKKSYVKEVKFWDKGKQIELAGKHLGMFIERHVHTIKPAIQVDEIDDRIQQEQQSLKLLKPAANDDISQ